MTGREIRRWAWQNWRENLGYLLQVHLLTMLPAVLPEVQRRLGILDIPILLYVETYIGRVLLLGSTLAVLTLIREGRRDLSLLLAPLGNKKALLLALLLTAYGLAQDWVTACIEDIKWARVVVSLPFFVVAIFFFTLKYDLFLFPKRSLRELFADSVAVGRGNFGDIFLFNLICDVMYLVPLFLLALLGIFIPVVSAVLIGGYAFLSMCYINMAKTRMAMEVSGVGYQAKKHRPDPPSGSKSGHRKTKKR